MKGFPVGFSWIGILDRDLKMEFPTEEEHKEYLKERKEEDGRNESCERACSHE